MHTNKHSDPDSLAKLVDDFQAGGRYTLTRDEAIAALGTTDVALTKAVQRLVAKNRLAAPRRGFFVIVPIEYRQAGAPPPDWYIGDLMAFCDHPYYVGLLSAASLHGAAHHQPQEFQVIIDGQLRPVKAGRGRIRFFKKRDMESTPVMDVKTETGLMRVSTPEATALDLLRYLDAAGQLGHVATVLAELAEKMDSVRTVEAAKLDGSLPNAQRLGYLLDLVGAGDVASGLADWIAERGPRYLALRPDRPSGIGAEGPPLAPARQREDRGRSMIPRAHITAWRGTAPWATDAQVEQDLVISRALVDLYRDDSWGVGSCIRGGFRSRSSTSPRRAAIPRSSPGCNSDPGPAGRSAGDGTRLDPAASRLAHLRARGTPRHQGASALPAEERARPLRSLRVSVQHTGTRHPGGRRLLPAIHGA